jgi:hypothetical protein
VWLLPDSADAAATPIVPESFLGILADVSTMEGMGTTVDYQNARSQGRRPEHAITRGVAMRSRVLVPVLLVALCCLCPGLPSSAGAGEIKCVAIETQNASSIDALMVIDSNREGDARKMRDVVLPNGVKKRGFIIPARGTIHTGAIVGGFDNPSVLLYALDRAGKAVSNEPFIDQKFGPQLPLSTLKLRLIEVHGAFELETR